MPQCLTPKIVLLLLLCSLTAHAQLPDCEHIYLKKLNDEGVYNYNPTLPVSATNPVKNTISIPESFGLTVSHVLGSDPSVLTFYSVELSSGNYIYYDPVSKDWLNTRHKTGSPYAVNIAAGGKYIFNLDGVNGKVYRYDGTQPEVLITTVSDFVGGAPYDLVTDCEGNWYILNLRSTTPFLRKYNAEGTLLHSWVIYNPSGISVESGAGFAIIGTNLYTDNTATGGGITLYSMGKDTVEVLRTTSDNVLSVGDDLGCCAGNVP
ncbi:MAG TPA: hypothetical protein VL092_11055, partial [Chitinophagaceae bacterium]|nr:hypothetical protein [Chitinophagaceae bacterium]